jgi:hypothetical protein
MDRIEMLIEDIEKDGVFAISIVDRPAIESDFIYLSKEEVKFKQTEKGLIVGLALIPNKDIKRKTKDGELYNIFFSEETVEKTAQLFMRNQHTRSITLDHESKTDKAYVVESWIVEDPKKDKIALYGIDAVKGSWAVAMKVDDQELKQRILNGEYNGFSIEGKFEGEQKLSELEQIKELFKSIGYVEKEK